MDTRICALPECGKVFVPKRQGRFCCHKHCKLASQRKRIGVHSILLTCALPECGRSFWMNYEGKKPGFRYTKGKRYKVFCCAYHGDLHTRRRQKGVYKRILGKGPTCIAPGCQESVVLDEHHVEHGPKGSNKNSKTVWICPTHHMHIHRRYAEIRDGIFISLLPAIRQGIEKKMKNFDGYKKSLGT